jgi:hypothetical protein
MDGAASAVRGVLAGHNCHWIRKLRMIIQHLELKPLPKQRKTNPNARFIRYSQNCRPALLLAAYRSAAVSGRNSWTCFGKNSRLLERKGSSISKELELGSHPFSFYTVQMWVILFTRKEVIIKIWPNHDDSDRVSIVFSRNRQFTYAPLPGDAFPCSQRCRVFHLSGRDIRIMVRGWQIMERRCVISG